MPALIRALVVVNGVTFLLFAISHAGIAVPLGFVTLAEPRIVPAMIVEGLCGAGFVVSALALFSRRRWAGPATLAAHLFALAGVFLGIAALTAGRGPRTATNDIYHRVMIFVLLVGITLCITQFRRDKIIRV
jgi:hypothetical protein